jgi:LysM repeat protein
MPLAHKRIDTYFRSMKRFLALFILCTVIQGTASRAQDNASSPSSNSAATIATKQDAEENYNALRSQIEDLQTAQVAQNKKIQQLLREIEDMKEQLSKPKADVASQESLRQLAETVQELDKKRQSDKELILKEFERLGKAVADAPVRSNTTHGGGGSGHKSSSEENRGETSTPTTNPNQQGYYYTIKSGDSLSMIAKYYKEQGVKVGAQQIADANPKVNPGKLLVGTKIFIPDNSKK